MENSLFLKMKNNKYNLIKIIKKKSITLKSGTCKTIKWSDIDNVIAIINQMLTHGGIAIKDWFSDKLY